MKKKRFVGLFLGSCLAVVAVGLAETSEKVSADPIEEKRAARISQLVVPTPFREIKTKIVDRHYDSYGGMSVSVDYVNRNDRNYLHAKEAFERLLNREVDWSSGVDNVRAKREKDEGTSYTLYSLVDLKEDTESALRFFVDYGVELVKHAAVNQDMDRAGRLKRDEGIEQLCQVLRRIDLNTLDHWELKNHGRTFLQAVITAKYEQLAEETNDYEKEQQKQAYETVIDCLATQSIDKNLLDVEDGYTALQYAAYYGDVASVSSLLNRGADVRIRTYSEETALEIAKRIEFPEVVSLLENAMNENV